jgi:thioredoxin-related protein
LRETRSVKSLRRFVVLTLASALLLGCSARADVSWSTDYKKAQEEARNNKKLLLLNFTGSDWCGWCIKLDREIFSKPEFKDYASKNLVLLTIDFPRAKSQPTTIRQQNQELAQQYQIEAFPTIIVLNGDGRKVWEYPGYFPDGADAFIAQLEKLRKS